MSRSPSSQEAIEDVDRHTLTSDEVDPVPMPENGGHAHSAAAHLETSPQPHTKPADNLRQGSSLGQLREPPVEQGRLGKLHRGQ